MRMTHIGSDVGVILICPAPSTPKTQHFLPFAIATAHKSKQAAINPATAQNLPLFCPSNRKHAKRAHQMPCRDSLQSSKGPVPMNDNGDRPVYIIVGRVWRKKGGESEGCHVLLTAPDDDTAVKASLEALAQEGYVEAELDQIGEMTEIPDEEPHMSAYQGATEGEVSIVTFEEIF